MSPQIGPRLELEVVKVEEGLCDGKVLFHSFVHKTAGQAAQQKRHLSEKEQEEQLRARRRHQQVSIMWFGALHRIDVLSKAVRFP